MTVEAGKVAIVRFPGDAGGGTIAVAIVRAYRGQLALVAKTRGRALFRHWARPRWVPIANIAREATPREVAVGMAIDPLPPRVTP